MKYRDSAYFFIPIQCNECQSKEKLMVHKYTDEFMCFSCVQDKKHGEPPSDKDLDKRIEGYYKFWSK